MELVVIKADGLLNFCEDFVNVILGGDAQAIDGVLEVLQDANKEARQHTFRRMAYLLGADDPALTRVAEMDALMSVTIEHIASRGENLDEGKLMLAINENSPLRQWAVSLFDCFGSCCNSLWSARAGNRRLSTALPLPTASTSTGEAIVPVYTSDIPLTPEEKLERMVLPAAVRVLVDRAALESKCQDQDGSRARKWLSWVSEIPFGEEPPVDPTVEAFMTEVNRSHLGMKDVKARLATFVAVMNRRARLATVGDPPPPPKVLLLAGPPGVGKTTFAEAIARGLNREFCQVRMGGGTEALTLVGVDRAYIGAEPGSIVQEMIRVRSRRAVFLLDEVDKMSAQDYRGNLLGVLLALLDPTQMSRYTDEYLGFGIDLTGMFFILTANELEGLHPALLDRCEVIALAGYGRAEKEQLLREYALPRARAEVIATADEIYMTEEAMCDLLAGVAEPGMRGLEWCIRELVSEAAGRLEIEFGGVGTVAIGREAVAEILASLKVHSPDSVRIGFQAPNYNLGL